MSRRVSVLIDDDQYEWLKEHAVNLSGFVRWKLRQYIQKNTDPDTH